MMGHQSSVSSVKEISVYARNRVSFMEKTDTHYRNKDMRVIAWTTVNNNIKQAKNKFKLDQIEKT